MVAGGIIKVMFRKWNGDNKPIKGQDPLPKGDPRDKINAHNRSLAKKEIREELGKLEQDRQEEFDLECELMWEVYDE
jgi:hypothetical protein